MRWNDIRRFFGLPTPKPIAVARQERIAHRQWREAEDAKLHKMTTEIRQVVDETMEIVSAVHTPPRSQEKP